MNILMVWKDLLLVCACACACVSVSCIWVPDGPEESIEPWSWSHSGCEVPDTSGQILWKSSRYFSYWESLEILMSHLFI